MPSPAERHAAAKKPSWMDALLGPMNPKLYGADMPTWSDIGGLLEGLIPPAPTPPPQANWFSPEMLAWAAQQPGVMPGATVYHGTPHRFAPTPKNPLGEFDLSKIGTGEGAQAYGHGLYLADSPSVAGAYAGRVPNKDFVRKVRDVYDEMVSPDEALEALSDAGLQPYESDLVRALQSEGFWGFDYPHQAVAEALRGSRNFEAGPAVRDALSRVPNRTIYRVDLPDEHIGRMLDWDAPLSQQPAVRDALAPLAEDLFDTGPAIGANRRAIEAWTRRAADDPSMRPVYEANIADSQRAIEELMSGMQPMSGQGAYQSLAGRLGSHPAASGLLGQHGIPGLKYFDQGSRGAGAGTRNYVVWQPEILRILGIEP